MIVYRLRWSLPSHLLDAIFSCCGMPILADVADSRVAIEILDELQTVINEGFTTLQLQKSPHLTLVSKNFYDSKMKNVLAKWLLLWMRARKVMLLKIFMFPYTNTVQMKSTGSITGGCRSNGVFTQGQSLPR